MEETRPSVPSSPGWSKIRSRSFVMDRMDAHFYLRTNMGEYKKTRWTELGVVQLKEDLADALNYVEEMRNLITLLEKEDKKFQKMPSASLVASTPSPSPPSAVSHLISSAPVPLHPPETKAKGQTEKEETKEKEKRTKSKRVKRPSKDKTKKKDKERGVIMDRLNNFLSSNS